ncbi:hypothetical protein PR048_010681 [Dryococelus australis]|uniref:Uncharacterized protein n=1 Tax=Dryococelus australis TaxID=614101 RepID=A0ABQ9I3F9_9NEOP|nr:hypothetical protein PR048_010681 [Dryococelus australis]
MNRVVVSSDFPLGCNNLTLQLWKCYSRVFCLVGRGFAHVGELNRTPTGRKVVSIRRGIKPHGECDHERLPPRELDLAHRKGLFQRHVSTSTTDLQTHTSNSNIPLVYHYHKGMGKLKLKTILNCGHKILASSTFTQNFVLQATQIGLEMTSKHFFALMVLWGQVIPSEQAVAIASPARGPQKVVQVGNVLEVVPGAAALAVPVSSAVAKSSAVVPPTVVVPPATAMPSVTAALLAAALPSRTGPKSLISLPLPPLPLSGYSSPPSPFLRESVSPPSGEATQLSGIAEAELRREQKEKRRQEKERRRLEKEEKKRNKLKLATGNIIKGDLGGGIQWICVRQWAAWKLVKELWAWVEVQAEELGGE